MSFCGSICDDSGAGVKLHPTHPVQPELPRTPERFHRLQCFCALYLVVYILSESQTKHMQCLLNCLTSRYRTEAPSESETSLSFFFVCVSVSKLANQPNCHYNADIVNIQGSANHPMTFKLGVNGFIVIKGTLFGVCWSRVHKLMYGGPLSLYGGLRHARLNHCLWLFFEDTSPDHGFDFSSKCNIRGC